MDRKEREKKTDTQRPEENANGSEERKAAKHGEEHYERVELHPSPHEARS